MTTDLDAALVRFFTQVAQRNPGQLNKLRAAAFSIESERWTFTLPGLYDYLREYEAIGEMEYNQFRQLLFSTPVNQSISDYGAKIIIVDNRGKTDQSIYAMEWQTPAGEQ